jgi:hypothetical protein
LKQLLRLELGANRRGIGAEDGHFQPLADAGPIPLNRERGDAERLAIGIGVVDEAAGAQHVRIIKQVFGAIDRREADVEPVQRCGKLAGVPALDHRSSP